MFVKIDSSDIEVIIEKKRTNKNTYLRVKSDNKIYVTTNYLTSDKQVKELIEDNLSKMRSMLNHQEKKKSYQDEFYYLGKRYDVVRVNNNSITLGDEKAFFGSNIDIDKWLLSQAKEIFLIRYNELFNDFKYTIPYYSLKLRKMKTRWGVCNYKSKTITLNIELIKKDINCLDYVIIHELSHLICRDHSKEFWQVVEVNFPKYKETRKSLKNYD